MKSCIDIDYCIDLCVDLNSVGNYKLKSGKVPGLPFVRLRVGVIKHTVIVIDIRDGAEDVAVPVKVL